MEVGFPQRKPSYPLEQRKIAPRDNLTTLGKLRQRSCSPGIW